MSLKSIFRIAKRLAPIVITYAPVVAAAVKEVKRGVKKPKA